MFTLPWQHCHASAVTSVFGAQHRNEWVGTGLVNIMLVANVLKTATCNVTDCSIVIEKSAVMCIAG